MYKNNAQQEHARIRTRRRTMFKLNERIHGTLDYVTVVFLIGTGLSGFFSPYFSHLMIALAVIHLLLTVFTDFSVGLVKLVPLKIHGYVELVVSVALIPAPYLLHYATEARAKVFTWVFAAILFVLFMLTDYRQTTAASPTR
jgi:hypothetical protein